MLGGGHLVTAKLKKVVDPVVGGEEALCLDRSCAGHRARWWRSGCKGRHRNARLSMQLPAVLHKDVLSQADVLLSMKLTASQDRDAVGRWIEG